MMKYLFALSCLILAFTSCSNDLEITTSNNEINTIHVSTNDFLTESRTSVNSSNYAVSWDNGDIIGIFPMEENSRQIAFDIEEGSGTNSASFNGKGWGLKSTSSYVAYYPYHNNGLLNQTAVPLDYTQQTQNGNGNSEHLGKSDYLTASASTPDNGILSFTFEHVGALLHFRFTVPEAGNYTSLTLKTNGSFILKGELNLANKIIKPTSQNNSLTLNLNNATIPANNVLEAFLMIAPNDLSGMEITTIVSSSQNYTYTTTLSGKNFKAGEYYNFTGSVEKMEFSATGTISGHNYVDLGIKNQAGYPVYWATVNVGAENPWEDGGYYAWGETKAYGEEDTSNLHNYGTSGNSSYVKNSYKWDTYKWATGNTIDTVNKYYAGDGKTVLDPEDDATTANWGSDWRMPTMEEFQALIKECYWCRDYYHDKVGFFVYKAKDEDDKGYLGNSPKATYGKYDERIFLTAPGDRFWTIYPDNINREGFYWCSDLNSDSYDTNYLYLCCYMSYTRGMKSDRSKCYGLSIRPVYVPQN